MTTKVATKPRPAAGGGALSGQDALYRAEQAMDDLLQNFL